MSVVSIRDPNSELAKFVGGLPETCSYCVNPLIDPVVFWDCAYTRLWLHPECAHTLALRLLFDAERARNIIQGKALESGIERPFLDRDREPREPPDLREPSYGREPRTVREPFEKR